MHVIGLHRAIDEGMTLPAIVGESILALINITLPDGTVNEYAAGITCSEVITDVLGRKNGCLAALVDGHERDMSYEIHDSCQIEGIKAESDAGMHILRHSAAHLLAQAVMAIYPDAKPTIGPAIDRGFYYDFAMETITESDLKPIQKKMQEIARKNLTVERVELDDGELREHFAANPYTSITSSFFSLSYMKLLVSSSSFFK